MRYRGLVLALFAILSVALSGCGVIGPVQLPSGSRVVVTQIGKMYFPKSSALTIRYETSLDQKDMDKLQREANELLIYEQKLINKFGANDVVLAAQKTSGSGFIHFSRGFNFVYQRREGKWYSLQSDHTWQPVPISSAAPKPSNDSN